MMKTRLLHKIIMALLIGLFITSNSFAQDIELKNYRIRFNFNTYKQADNSRLLEVSFIAANKKDRKDKLPIYEADILFYNVLNEEEVKIGDAKTNEEGIARLIISEDQTFLTDEEGFINLKAVFEGSDDLKSKEDEITVKDIFMELDLKEIDSIKTVILNAYTLDSLQTKVPVSELDVVFFIGGMISKMPIEDGTLEDGKFEFEFPNDIPGNSQGDIDVYVVLEDHDEFATVTQKKTINWGVFKKVNVEQSNTLWTEAAPIWMYVVLTILLVGVWSNYIYSFLNLLKIKKEGKELELETEK